mmetsp:Transcript_70591/g.184034  ORF Transcript_70591/g.184034 Transcript_70591/m.184034 type:complete len:203 (-) Transcript_70591:482-1090(-)
MPQRGPGADGPRSRLPHPREGERRDRHKEGLEDHVGEHAREEAVRGGVLPGVDPVLGVLDPGEEQRVVGPDLVRRLGLLDGEPVERARGRGDEPQGAVDPGVLRAVAVEVVLLPRAAVRADGPEVVGGRLGRALDDGGDAVRLLVLEAHGLVQVQVRALGKHYTTCVHELGATHERGIHVRIAVQMNDLLVRQCVVDVVEEA